jgi:tetratricopeptide (TPR) repeat protein
LIESLGLSRDVVALAWAGGRLLDEGKPDAASWAYGAALEMASRADLDHLDPPTFREDKHIRRYQLPYEDLIGDVVRAMAGHDGWTFSQWSAALPDFAVAPLTATRALEERGRLDEAEKAIDLTLSRAQGPPPPGCSQAVHLAAEAEAMALRGRWREAEERYRQAIDLMPRDTFRRSWYMNLANLYVHLNDDTRKRDAWEAAKGAAPDEISRRAAHDQTQAGSPIGVANHLTGGPLSASPPRSDAPDRVRRGIETRLISAQARR